MAIETYLYTRLAGSSALTTLLSHLVNPAAPAIFERVAFPDTDPRWGVDTNGGTLEYPRVVYVLDRANSNAQILTGSLHVQIWARSTSDGSLEAVEDAIVALLDDAAMVTDEGLVVFNLQTATAFQSTVNTRVIGVDLLFAFHAYPTQTTFSPDPVAALNRFTSAVLDSHISVLPSAWSPTDQDPALYWRLVSMDTAPRDEVFFGSWVNVRLEGHVLAPSPFARNNWVRLIGDAIKARPHRRILLDDTSPLFVLHVAENMAANPYVQGQIQLDARLGLLNQYVPVAFTNPPIEPIGQGSPPPAPIPATSPPGTIPVSQPAYVTQTDTGQPLRHVWRELTIPADGTSLPYTD